MLKIFSVLSSAAVLFAAFFSIAFISPVLAQESTPEAIPETATPAVDFSSLSLPTYTIGRVEQILEEQQIEFDDRLFYVQKVLVQDKESGEKIELEVGTEFQPLTAEQRLTPGTQVVLSRQPDLTGGEQIVVSDVYRLPAMAWLLIGFFLLVLVVSGKKGFFSILGMFLSMLVLLKYIVPAILSGGNPVFISLIGSALIGGVTVYLSHGLNVKSHVALASMTLTLVVVSLLSVWYVSIMKLVGLGSEEAYFLQFGPTAQVNLQGLLLGGIMLGALGVLDDITVSQVSIVFELKKANAKLRFHELYQRGMNVGRDHVASLVNTLVLAYAGANLPLFMLFSLSSQTPSWVHLNTELLAEEVVRTLVGSIGLVLAVPLTTALAAYAAGKSSIVDKVPSNSHSHAH